MPLLAILAVVGLLVLGASSSQAKGPPRSPGSFPDGGAFYRTFSADFAAAGAPSWLSLPMSYTVSEIETDFGGSDALAQTNSYFNRHVGSGAGDWSGHDYLTSKGEDLRVYDSRPQSIRDFAQLVGGSAIYSSASAAMRRGDADGFFMGIVTGNGAEGYVGQVYVNDDPAQGLTSKAAGYLAGLRSRYARSFA